MNRRVINAAKRYLIEVCRSEDKYALIDYQMHLIEMYSELVTEMIMEEVINKLFKDYPNAYEWLNSLSENLEELKKGEIEVKMLTADDLYYLLISNQPKSKLTENASFSEFKFHPKDPNKILIKRKEYENLKKVLIEIYSDKDRETKIEINIEELVEIIEDD